MAKEWDDMDNLIGKCLSGEATAGEKLELEHWLQESKLNQKYFDQAKTIFEKAASAKVETMFDTDAAWNRVRRQLSGSQHRPFRLDFAPWLRLRVAAGIAIVLGVGFFTYQWMRKPIQTFAVVTDRAVVQDTLPDGTLAFLNKKSELSFEYDPGKKSRKVKLKGEAYFSVKHDEEKPFVIETDEVLVRDIGTEFNLKSYPDQDTIEIVVTSGEVQFYTLKNSGLNLKAGEKGVYSKGSKSFYRIERIDTNELAYKTKVFSFNSTDLSSVINLLNEVYETKIELVNPRLRTCRLTANFSEDNPDTIVEVIAETMGLTITRKEDKILLDGKGCEK